MPTIDQEPSLILANSRFIAPSFMRSPGGAGVALRVVGGSHVKLGARAVVQGAADQPENNMYGVSEAGDQSTAFGTVPLVTELGEQSTLTAYEPATDLLLEYEGQTATAVLEGGIDSPVP